MNIQVVIDKSRNCNSLLSKKSAYLRFQYKEEIVNYLRALKHRYYDAELHCWEIQESDLLNFCKKFSKTYPTQVIDAYKEPSVNKEDDLPIPDTYQFHLQPFKYQRDGIQFGINHSCFLLADEMGLGKSLQSLCITDITCTGKVLILCCSTTLRQMWKKEVKKILGKDAYVLDGDSRKILDTLQHINDIKEKFIITNIHKLPLLKEKKGRSWRYPIAEEINNQCIQHNIEGIIIDEFHLQCFKSDTLITTNKGLLRIGDIVEHQLKCKVLSYNETTKKYEYKNILNYIKNPCSEKMLELKFKDDNNKLEVLRCTENHKIFTKNRGWVKAKDLNEYDDIEFNKIYQKSLKELTNTDIDYIKNNINIKVCSDIYNELNISRYVFFEACKKYNIKVDINIQSNLIKKRMQTACLQNYGVSSYSKTEEHKKFAHENMVKNNPSSNPELNKIMTKHRMETRRKNGTLNNWTSCGNGKISPTEKVAKEILEPLGYIYNKCIGCKELRKKYPEKHFAKGYKPDFLNETKKIVIEIDGPTHNNKIAKEIDKKKDWALNKLGYKVYRFTNDFVNNNLKDFIEEVKKL